MLSYRSYSLHAPEISHWKPFQFHQQQQQHAHKKVLSFHRNNCKSMILREKKKKQRKKSRINYILSRSLFGSGKMKVIWIFSKFLFCFSSKFNRWIEMVILSSIFFLSVSLKSRNFLVFRLDSILTDGLVAAYWFSIHQYMKSFGCLRFFFSIHQRRSIEDERR